jgi:hypothetical protein
MSCFNQVHDANVMMTGYVRASCFFVCCRGTLARQTSEWQPECSEQDMLRLLHVLRDVACGLKLLKAQHVVHADLVRRAVWPALRICIACLLCHCASVEPIISSACWLLTETVDALCRPTVQPRGRRDATLPTKVALTSATLHTWLA